MVWLLGAVAPIIVFSVGWWLTGGPGAGNRPSGNAGVRKMQGPTGDVSVVLSVAVLTCILVALALIFERAWWSQP